MKLKNLLVLNIVGILFLVGCTKTANVNAHIKPKGSGRVNGEGEYKVGKTVNLQAETKEGYLFIGWLDNDKIFEEEKEYKFTVKSDRNLVAKFKRYSKNRN